jgi:uncharacterized protein (TIGR03435 family)
VEASTIRPVASKPRTVSDLIFFAFETDRFRTVGPDWLDDDRFDVVATGAANGQNRPMVRQLLRDRFALRTHSETRRVPVCVLTILRSDGVLGPNLQKVVADCSQRKVFADGLTPCSTRNQPSGTLVAHSANWETAILHREMRNALGRLVVDRTNLTGQFDMKLEWSDPSVQASGDLADHPSLTTAVREQLGLKLEPATESLEVLVIDHVERPTPD